MIQLPSIPLPQNTLDALAGYQQEIDEEVSYAKKVEKAKSIWPSRSRNRPFDKVRQSLSDMCSGARRCGYCEDSMADEIEHIWPKNFYPERTFAWENLLYACGPCNSPKGNQFALFLPNHPPDKLILGHPENGPDQPPPHGRPVLIDPRHENPLNFLWLDIQDSFVFTPMNDDENSEEWIRATYTITILKLNERDALVEARRIAYSNYRARLREYIAEKNNGVTSSQLDKLRMYLQAEHHPTVWKEMKRQQVGIPELKILFEQAPEAQTW